MGNNEEYFNFLTEAQYRRNNGESWSTILKEFNDLFGENITKKALRCRVARYNKSCHKEAYQRNSTEVNQNSENTSKRGEYTTIDGNGILTAQRFLRCQHEVVGEPNKLLEALGYKSSQWEIISLTTKTWEQGSKEGTKDLYSIGIKLKRKNDLSCDDVLDSLKTLLAKNITPVELPSIDYNSELKPNLMMEISPVELHMGKLSNADETGENYDLKICKKIFEDLVTRI